LNRHGWTIRETVEWEFGRGSGRTRANRGRECHNHGLESEDSADYAADDGVARTMAPLHELQLWWDDPNDPRSRQAAVSVDVADRDGGFRARGGKDPDLPGTGAVSGSGRVDLRLAVDRSGELYLLSKSDGVIRAVIGASAAPDTFKQAARPEQYRIP
jgi:hypothetical protein